MKVFVHGVPETPAIWDPLLSELCNRGIEDVVVLVPPGFGEAPPASWVPSYMSYRQWLIGAIEQLRANGELTIDLVGHDWGAGHVLGLLSERPDLVTSWTTDCGGLIHPDYIWHDSAQIWQTEGAGEESFAALLSVSAADRAAGFQALGMTAEVALAVAEGVNQDMVDCILPLYRSAVQPALADLGDRLAESLPRTSHHGMILMAAADTYAGTSEMSRNSANRLGASFHEMDNVGHWWMCENPKTAATLLVDHWSTPAGSPST